MKRAKARESSRAAPAALGRLGASIAAALPRSSWAVPGLAIFAGLSAGFATPSGAIPIGWLWVYTPLFLALDLLLRRAGGRGSAGLLRSWRLWGKALACCMVLGVLQAAINGAWVVNTAHVFGALPLPMAHAVNLFGYGALFGVEAFFFLALPFLLAWRRPLWGFFFVIFWATALQSFVPRFFAWTFGMFLHSTQSLVQVIDVIGTEGLNLPVLALHLLLFGWVREGYAPGTVGRRALAWTSAGVVLLFAGMYGYGHWRIADVAQATAQGNTVNLVGVQPSFSLRNLASNPALTHSDRDKSLSALLADTEQGLGRLQADPAAPTVVVWPESVYPAPYFRADRARRALESWVRIRGLHLVLTSLTADIEPGSSPRRRRVFGSSLHISPDGRPPEDYRKITLIPFGESIPLGGVFPAFRAAIKAWIPQISEFDAGREFTVFHITPTLRLAPMICFDAIGDSVSRGMVANGANFGLVLANLSWFGRTNVSDMFEFFVRFRAIEARIPFLLLSQNGRSILFDAAGRPASRALGQYEEDALAIQAKVPNTSSFFVRHRSLVHWAYALILLGLIGFPLLRMGKQS